MDEQEMGIQHTLSIFKKPFFILKSASPPFHLLPQQNHAKYAK